MGHLLVNSRGVEIIRQDLMYWWSEGGQRSSLGRWKNGTCVLRSEEEQIRSEDQNFSEESSSERLRQKK